jgi:peptidoglycan/LPS O-acetylase OafA/YrhL
MSSAFLLPQLRIRLASLFGHPIPPHQNYVRGFDAVRGGAALLVVIGHCVYFAQPAFPELPRLVVLVAGRGSLAVPIFCVLSGFLISRAVFQIKTVTDVKAYCTRRFFRIYPVYAVAVLLALLLGQYSTSSMSPDTSTSARFFADLFMMRVLWWPGFANPVAWSLYHEVLFYALLPLTVLTVGNRRVGQVALFILTAMLLADYPSRDYGLYKYFVFGVLSSFYNGRFRAYAALTLGVGIALIVVEFIGFDLAFSLGATPAKMRVGGGFGLGLGVAMLLAALPHVRIVGKILDFLPLRLLGNISYSLYVIHPLVLRLVFPQIGNLSEVRNYKMFSPTVELDTWWLFLILIPAILFWAAIFFLVVERPFMKLGAALLKNGSAVSTALSPGGEQQTNGSHLQKQSRV